MAPQDVLARKRIYDLIWQYPGIHMREIHRLTGSDLSLAEYHLNQLQKQGAITSFEQGGYRRFFPLASPERPLTHDDRRILGLLRQEAPFAIVMLLLDRGTVQHKDLAVDVGLSKSALTYQLRKLETAGVVRKTPRGEQRGFSLQDPGRIRQLLQYYRPTPDLVDEYGRLWDLVYEPADAPPTQSEGSEGLDDP